MVFLIIPSEDGIPFDLLTNPMDYGAAFIVEFTDDEWAYTVKVVDHFQEAAATEDDPSLLCPWIQDEDTPEENWTKQLKEMYKIPLSEQFIIISNTATFCHTINSH
jgi:hypothetical protein